VHELDRRLGGPRGLLVHKHACTHAPDCPYVVAACSVTRCPVVNRKVRVHEIDRRLGGPPGLLVNKHACARAHAHAHTHIGLPLRVCSIQCYEMLCCKQ
jgi:hypothetical protein